MKQYDILIVEDDQSLSEALSETLEIENYKIISAKHGVEALTLLEKHHFQLVISDVQMPVMDGLELLRHIQQEYAHIPVLLMTAYGTIPKAVEAMQAGAVDYLIKPFDAKTLVAKVASLIHIGEKALFEELNPDSNMKKLYGLAAKVAKTNVTMLLEGESGTGKEVMARFIHQNSLYATGPFEAINCAAIPENMLEAMLFGYEKGAFTGASQSMPGKFEQAQGGTLLLDEISEMDVGLQAKLLRVLQEKEVERLGSHRKIELKVRILATTNRKLKEYVQAGRFREDLYFRLSVFPIKIPPLRERIGEILPLAQEFLHKFKTTKGTTGFTAAAINKLQNYNWPGNVRELENVIQRAVILQNHSLIGVEDLIFEDDTMQDSCMVSETAIRGNTEQENSIESIDLPALGSLGDGVRSAEEKIILQILQEASGSRKTTAEKLGISPRTLRYKLARMKESGISVPC